MSVNGLSQSIDNTSNDTLSYLDGAYLPCSLNGIPFLDNYAIWLHMGIKYILPIAQIKNDVVTVYFLKCNFGR